MVGYSAYGAFRLVVLTPWFAIEWCHDDLSFAVERYESGMWVAAICENWTTRGISEAVAYRYGVSSITRHGWSEV